MKKNMLVAMSFLLSAVMILSSSVVAFAADTTVLTASETCFVRDGSNADTLQSSSMFVLDGGSDNHRVSFMRLDFTDVDLESYPGIKLRLISIKGNNASMDGKDIDVKISIIPEEAEELTSVSSVTYNLAKTAGWLESFDTIGTVGGTIVDDALQNNTFYSSDISGAIKSDIEKNNDKTVILKLESNIAENGLATVYYATWGAGDSRNAQLVAMTQAEIDDSKSKANADADAISISGNATPGNTITLPSEGSVNGSKITWESDSAYINAKTGVVSSPASFANEIVTLTANVNNNGIVVSKEFQVTVPGGSQHGAIEACYVRNGSNADTFQSNQMFVLDGGSDNHRVGFMKLDFSDVDFENYPGIKLMLTTIKGNNSKVNGSQVELKISIVPNDAENPVSLSTLTYNQANSLGWLEASDAIGTISGTVVNDSTQTNTFYSTDILAALRAVVENSNSKTVVLKLESSITENNHESVYYANWGGAGDSRNAQLVAMTQEEVAQNKANANADAEAIVIPDAVSYGGTITLPSVGVNGSKITWKSDSEYINAETGEASSKIGFADETVGLTATVNYSGMVVTKAFQVTVTGSKIQPASDCVTLRGYEKDDGRAGQNLPGYLMINGQTSDNRTQGVMRFDISAIKEEINALDDISLRLTVGKVKEGTNDVDYNNGRYYLSILPDNNWTTGTLTLNYAIENNLISGAQKAASTGTVATAVGNTIVFGGLKNDIQAFIDNNPEATTISFILTTDSSKYEDSVSFYVMNGAEEKATESTQPLLIGETQKRFTALNNNGEVTITYNADSTKYPTGINMPATFFVAEYSSDEKLVNVVIGSDDDSLITNGETKVITIDGYTSGNKIKLIVLNNSTEIIPVQPAVIFGN